MEEKLVVPEEESDKHQTVIEWETDTERVKITFRVERFPKEETASATATATPEAA